jgi:hypothetical protein
MTMDDAGARRGRRLFKRSSQPLVSARLKTRDNLASLVISHLRRPNGSVWILPRWGDQPFS